MQWIDYLSRYQDRLIEDVIDLIRIPSVSALPEHAPDVQRAATFVARRLAAAGIANVSVLPTGRHPLVVGEWNGAPGKPTVMLYGHFDVQPADPLGLWTSPPFDPALRDGRIFGRGASDMKGNLIAVIAAVQAMLETTGTLPVNVRFLFDGEEEIGSPSLPAIIAAHQARLACDVVVSGDGVQWSESEPAVVMSIRGSCTMSFDVIGPAMDVHSGIHGGAVQNPLHALAAMVASLHSPDGKVAVEGFYDDVATVSAEERDRIASVPHDDGTYRASVGVDALFGEEGYSTPERIGIRPTLEINGMWGGFQGAGSKTIIPAEAHAKLSCRLVPDQDPERIRDCIQAHLEKHTLPGTRVVIHRRPGVAYPYVIPASHPGIRAARSVLAERYGREPYHWRLGATLPVSGILQQQLGVHTVMFGFSSPDEQFHAPNEFFRLSSFYRAQIATGQLLQQLGAYAPAAFWERPE